VRRRFARTARCATRRSRTSPPPAPGARSAARGAGGKDARGRGRRLRACPCSSPWARGCRRGPGQGTRLSRAVGPLVQRARHRLWPRALACGQPKPKLATVSWWKDTTLYEDLGLEAVSTDEAYAAMDWLYERQDAIERALARRHLSVSVNPSGRAYFDLSSSWMEGGPVR